MQQFQELKGEDMAFFKVNNIDISQYINSLSFSHEIVWSTNAGRTLDATFVGDIVAKKWKLSVTTIPLKQSESALIQGLLEQSAFFNVAFIPPNVSTDKITSATFYTSSPAQEIYSYYKDHVRYKQMSFDLIEQ
jgi:hypothetical protein